MQQIFFSEPPSGITDLETTARNDTTITVRWRRPTITGRNDYFYRVFHSDPDNIGEFILAIDNLVNMGEAVTFTVTRLTPFTAYIIRVSVHNGVSDQDLENDNSRISESSNKTMEGSECWDIII